jgi:flagellar biosynthesis regulator FlaF
VTVQLVVSALKKWRFKYARVLKRVFQKEDARKKRAFLKTVALLTTARYENAHY